jgi:hypothetical protein
VESKAIKGAGKNKFPFLTIKVLPVVWGPSVAAATELFLEKWLDEGIDVFKFPWSKLLKSFLADGVSEGLLLGAMLGIHVAGWLEFKGCSVCCREGELLAWGALDLRTGVSLLFLTVGASTKSCVGFKSVITIPLLDVVRVGLDVAIAVTVMLGLRFGSLETVGFLVGIVTELLLGLKAGIIETDGVSVGKTTTSVTLTITSGDLVGFLVGLKEGSVDLGFSLGALLGLELLGFSVGSLVGFKVGCFDMGFSLGELLGLELMGFSVGSLVGFKVGLWVLGCSVGELLGLELLGFSVGSCVGFKVGLWVLGCFVGELLGVELIGFSVGSLVGFKVGLWVLGCFVGELLGLELIGFSVGSLVGFKVGLWVLGCSVGELDFRVGNLVGELLWGVTLGFDVGASVGWMLGFKLGREEFSDGWNGLLVELIGKGGDNGATDGSLDCVAADPPRANNIWSSNTTWSLETSRLWRCWWLGPSERSRFSIILRWVVFTSRRPTCSAIVSAIKKSFNRSPFSIKILEVDNSIVWSRMSCDSGTIAQIIIYH